MRPASALRGGRVRKQASAAQEAWRLRVCFCGGGGGRGTGERGGGGGAFSERESRPRSLILNLPSYLLHPYDDSSVLSPQTPNPQPETLNPNSHPGMERKDLTYSMFKQSKANPKPSNCVDHAEVQGHGHIEPRP